MNEEQKNLESTNEEKNAIEYTIEDVFKALIEDEEQEG